MTTEPEARTSLETGGGQSEHCQAVVGEIRGWARDVFFAIGTAILIVVFLYQPVRLKAPACCRNCLTRNGYSLTSSFIESKRFARKDIVVFWYPLDPTKSYIKRVIGMPGDVVEVRRGVGLRERQAAGRDLHPPEFLDHRTLSACLCRAGSLLRSWRPPQPIQRQPHVGLVPEKYIYGKAVFRYWPMNKMGILD